MFIMMDFEFEVTDALRLEEIGDFSGTVDDVGEFVDYEELQVLNRERVTIATSLLPMYSPSLIFMHSKSFSIINLSII